MVTSSRARPQGSPPAKSRGGRSRSFGRLAGLAALVLLGILAAAAGAGVALLHLNVAGLPSVEGLLNVAPAHATIFHAADGSELARLYEEHRVVVPLEDIPPHMRNAVIAVEDRKFWSHWGVDLFGVGRALMADLVARRVVQGGSTITQQLARTLFLTQEVTVTRKVKEALLALRIERAFSKEEILALYLNQVYFGDGAHGVQAAAEVFLDKDARDLSLGECALLAGVIRSPRGYSLRRKLDRALARRRLVLRLMTEAGYIGAEEARSAADEPVELVPRGRNYRLAPYFAEQVRLYLEDKYGSDALYREGLRVYTTLDPVLQEAAERALAEGLRERESKLGDLAEALAALGIEEEELEQPLLLQGALLALEPGTGYVRAMVGGRDFYESNWNRAVQARRQPGSAFKLFVYATALENGYHAGTILYDRPLTVLTEDGTVYEPSNYEETFRGSATLRDAVAHSVNISAVTLIMELGGDRVVDCARRMGIESPLAGFPSLALGSFEVTLQEMTSAYAVAANQGVRAEPQLIARVEDREGRLLERNPPRLRQALSPETAYLLEDLLTSVVEYGTGRRARALGKRGSHTVPPERRRPLAAGKTGTTNEYTDAWFVGYLPGLAAGVWVGFDLKVSMGEKQSGAVVALPIWLDFMSAAKDVLPPAAEPEPPPQGLRGVPFCTTTGFEAGPYCPEIREELVPAEFLGSGVCPLHQPVVVESSPELPLPGWRAGG